MQEDYDRQIQRLQERNAEIQSALDHYEINRDRIALLNRAQGDRMLEVSPESDREYVHTLERIEDVTNPGSVATQSQELGVLLSSQGEYYLNTDQMAELNRAREQQDMDRAIAGIVNARPEG